MQEDKKTSVLTIILRWVTFAMAVFAFLAVSNGVRTQHLDHPQLMRVMYGIAAACVPGLLFGLTFVKRAI